MGTNIETMWVADRAQLDATVQTLVAQGGEVQGQGPDGVQLHLKKKLNVVALIGGLVLCIVPGLVYLAWYLTADQDQQITLRIGTPPTIRTGQQHWHDQPTPAGGGAPGSLPPAPGPPPTPAPDVEPTVLGSAYPPEYPPVAPAYPPVTPAGQGEPTWEAGGTPPPPPPR
jgi:hypothetical protein